MKWAKRQTGFTIVELLIVIVVIAILAAITIVAYNGIQNMAKESAAQSAAQQAGKKIEVAFARSGTEEYPETLQAAGLASSDEVAYQYTRSADRKSYCITTVYEGEMQYSIGSTIPLSSNPCDGHAGAPAYCPADTHVPINGFYCNGSVGSVASLNDQAVKLSATNAEVPAGAPGTYVARQTSRDNMIGTPFPVTAGEVYCLEGWAATSSSTVGHTLGLRLTGTSATHWAVVSYATPSGIEWKKMQGCITIPASGHTTAQMWSQNNGVFGTTANTPWYQTALRFWKR